jgi:uncharacterized protein YecA (UPF0149 family)
MLRLERELEIALAFEHSDGEDSGLKIQPIWITHILLGHLFRETKALGKEVKQFMRFQWREFMHSLVKINDLEEHPELSLSSDVRASTLATYRGDEMEIKEQIGMWEEGHLAH